MKLIVLAVTPKEANLWRDICKEFHDARDESKAAYEEVKQKWEDQGVMEQDVCDWVIYGLPSQDWLSLETQLTQYAQIIAEMRRIIEYYRERLDSAEQTPEVTVTQPVKE